MKAKEIIYERVKSFNFNNEKIGIVIEIEEGERAEDVMEKAKIFVQKQFGEKIMTEVRDKDIPF
jgi:hypothetical protein